jgi:WD40 repeat protein
VVADCRLSVIDKQSIPSQRDGVVRLVGTEVQAGEKVPADRLVVAKVGDQDRYYRRLREGDAVTAGQVVALLDDRLARDEIAIKKSQLVQYEADLAAAEHARDEAKDRYLTQVKLRGSSSGPATSEEDVGGAKVAFYKSHYEAISKKEAIALAKLEIRQAETILGMYEIRAAIPGIIKRIHKNPGEAIKALEPVLEIRDLGRLRVEGLVEVQQAARLRAGMRVAIMPAEAISPQQVRLGHLETITGVAVTKRLQLLSASDDGTVRLWDRNEQRMTRVLRHAAGVKAIACTPASAAGNLCLAGLADGSAWLWDLDARADSPRQELHGQHTGTVTCVAFSADGRACLTGGEDRSLCLWDVNTGRLRYRFPTTHLGAITSVHFAGADRLVSASRDNTLRLWRLTATSAVLENTWPHRSGDVADLGVSPDGALALFDQANALQVLALPTGSPRARIQQVSGTSRFTTFALFSPDSRIILTSGASEGRLQLWSWPIASGPALEFRQLIRPPQLSITCAAFSPDGSFLVTGARTGEVHVWALPNPGQLQRPLQAEITLIERAVETGGRQARIWAELPNPDGTLIPGTTATMVALPGKPAP